MAPGAGPPTTNSRCTSVTVSSLKFLDECVATGRDSDAQSHHQIQGDVSGQQTQVEQCNQCSVWDVRILALEENWHRRTNQTGH